MYVVPFSPAEPTKLERELNTRQACASSADLSPPFWLHFPYGWWWLWSRKKSQLLFQKVLLELGKSNTISQASQLAWNYLMLIFQAYFLVAIKYSRIKIYTIMSTIDRILFTFFVSETGRNYFSFPCFNLFSF